MDRTILLVSTLLALVGAGVVAAFHIGKAPAALPVLRALARSHRRDHALALELWASGIHDARLLATLVENPKQITRAQMEQWVRASDNWALTDALAFLFDRTEFAEAKALVDARAAATAGLTNHRPRPASSCRCTSNVSFCTRPVSASDHVARRLPARDRISTPTMRTAQANRLCALLKNPYICSSSEE